MRGLPGYFCGLLILIVAIPVFSQAQRVPIAAKSETIAFSNPAVGFNADLEGLLQFPEKPGKYPLVVFIHGSGRGTRFEYDNLFQLFLSKGFAVFSYDKRGVGKSGGTYNGVGPRNSPMMIPLLASDAYAGIETIKNRPDIDGSSVVLIGASQAGWIIPVVASMSKSVSNYVILYGPTVSVGQEIYYSQLAEDGSQSIPKAEEMLAGFDGLRGFDPMPYIVSLRQKGLWIFGGKDMSIPTMRSIRLLNSVNRSSDTPFTIKLYPEAGHGLKNAATGLFDDYVPFMMGWLEENTSSYRK